MVTRVVPNRKRNTLQPIIAEHVQPYTEVHTDEWLGYWALAARKFRHLRVNHDAGEYHVNGVGVQGIESFWAQLKRGINGTHIHVSAKHLPKYLGEFEFRHNRRHVGYSMLDELMLSFRH